MAPGPPNLGDNRFAPLLSLSPPRKKRNLVGYNFEFPELMTPTTDNPKYILISALESEKSLTSYSCFAINNSLLAIDKGILSISSLRDGKLLLLVKSKSIAEKFLNSTQLPGICKITCKLHETLNFVKGSIYAPYLNDIPDDEIIKELSSQKVVGIHKFKKLVDGTSKCTGTVLLTFDLYTLPQKINLAWHVAKIREYFPNPMRCKTCQRLGHTAKNCKIEAVCAVCSLAPHLPERACTQIQCVNCQLDHEASSRQCPKYVEFKELLKIKTQKKCTFREAKTYMVSNHTNNPNSYSSALTHNNNKALTTTNINKSTNARSTNNQKTTTIDTNINLHKTTQNTHTHTKPSSPQTIRSNANNSPSITSNTITSLKTTQNTISYDLSIDSHSIDDTNYKNNISQSSDLTMTDIKHSTNQLDSHA